jgi:predicted aspartyl protease
VRFSASWWFGALLFIQLVLPLKVRSQSAKALGPLAGMDSMPFQLQHDFLIVVEGRIGPLESLKFIVDTGASGTMVSTRIAAKLKLRRQPAEAIVLDKRLKMEYAVFPEIQVGRLRALNVQMLVGDLEKISEFGAHVDAILGLDMLSRCNAMEIDYEARKIRFANACMAYDQVRTTSEVFLVVATLQGHPIHLLIDTGMQGVVLFENRLRPHVESWEHLEKASAFLGALGVERVQLPSLWVGANQINLPVFVVPGERGGASEFVDGMLGPKALNAKQIELDFEAMRLRWN